MSEAFFKLKKINVRDKEIIYKEKFQELINSSHFLAQEIFLNAHLNSINRYVTSGEIIFDFTKINIPKTEIIKTFSDKLHYTWIRDGFTQSMRLPDGTLEEMLIILNELCHKVFPIKNESN